MTNRFFLCKKNGFLRLAPKVTYTITNSVQPQAIQTPNLIVLSDLPADDVEIIIVDDGQKVIFKIVGNSPVLKLNITNTTPKVLPLRRLFPYTVHVGDYRDLYIPTLKDGVLSFCVIQIKYTTNKELQLNLL